jgi:hypothetical protein
MAAENPKLKVAVEVEHDGEPPRVEVEFVGGKLLVINSKDMKVNEIFEDIDNVTGTMEMEQVWKSLKEAKSKAGLEGDE